MRTSIHSCIHQTLRNAGFALLELIGSLLVLSIVLSMAVPALRTYQQDDEQWMQQKALLESLNRARSEAVEKRAVGGVKVCASTNGDTCNGTSWSEGWVVLSSASAKPLQVVAPLPPGMTLTETSGNLAITFVASGALDTLALANRARPVGFIMCDSRGGEQARYTQVSLAGRVSPASQTGQDSTDAALACPPQ
jgi:type IV fimbrial biogenesis protein FimT